MTELDICITRSYQWSLGSHLETVPCLSSSLHSLCQVLLHRITTKSKNFLTEFFFRTENIAEDEKYYKSVSGLNDRTGQDVIEHGNSSPRKCKFILALFL